MNQRGRQPRLLTPRLRAFMATMILANIAAMMVLPLESLYLQELGASVQQVGLFFTVAYVAPLLFQILGGWLSDSMGRLQAIALGSIGGAASYLFYIFAPSWIWLLPASVLAAVAGAFVAPSFQAFVAEESTEETRGRVYGVTSTLYAIVGIVGPLLGSIVAQQRDFKTMYILAGALYASAAFFRILMAARSRKARLAEARVAQQPSLSQLGGSLKAIFALITAGGIVTWIFISDGVRDTAFSLIRQLMPLYLQNVAGLTLIQIGTLQSITSVVAMVLMSPAGWLADKKGERTIIVGGFGLIGLGWLAFLSGSAYWHFLASRIFIGAGWAFIDPAYSSLISKVVPQKLRGTAFGLFSTSLGLISLPAPWIGAKLWDTVSPRFPFYIPLVAMFAMMPLIWLKFRLPNESLEVEEADAVLIEDRNLTIEVYE